HVPSPVLPSTKTPHTAIYPLSLHDALPISDSSRRRSPQPSKTARIARSRLLFGVLRLGAARGSGPVLRLTNSLSEHPISWIPLPCEYRPQVLGSASRLQPPRRPACARPRVSHS